MTAVFEKDDLQFMYPENWTLCENTETEDFIEVSLEAPGGSIWSASIFESSHRPEELLDSCANALSDQYEDFERVDLEAKIGQWETQGFDSHFYCLDFLVTAKARALELSGKTINIYCQAESREFDQMEDVFDAITHSLLNSIASRQ